MSPSAALFDRRADELRRVAVPPAGVVVDVDHRNLGVAAHARSPPAWTTGAVETTRRRRSPSSWSNPLIRSTRRRASFIVRAGCECRAPCTAPRSVARRCPRSRCAPCPADRVAAPSAWSRPRARRRTPRRSTRAVEKQADDAGGVLPRLARGQLVDARRSEAEAGDRQHGGGNELGSRTPPTRAPRSRPSRPGERDRGRCSSPPAWR